MTLGFRCRSVGARAVTLAALLIGTDGQAADTHSTAERGEWSGDYVRVRWRETRHTTLEPETMVLVQSLVPGTVVVAVKGNPLICTGVKAGSSSSTESFMINLFSRMNETSHLEQGEWDAWMFPKGLRPPGKESTATDGCVTHIVIHAHARDGRDEFKLILPAHDEAFDPHRDSPEGRTGR